MKTLAGKMIITQEEQRGLDIGELNGIICPMDRGTRILVVLLALTTIIILIGI